MLIAKEKRKSNIAEYILYMWQVEDTIRAFNFNMNTLEERIIAQFNKSEKVQNEIRDWYANIMVMMHEEGIKESGHLKILKLMVDDLFEYHKKLLKDKSDPNYLEKYSIAAPNIKEFAQKLGVEMPNEIEVCLTAMYALLLLKLKKKNISEGTIYAMQTFSSLLSGLSENFKKIEEGKQEF